MVWLHHLITKKITGVGLHQLVFDPCVFTGDGMLLVCYVEDLLVSECTDKDELKLQDHLRKDLIMKALGKPTSFLGKELGWHKGAI